MPPDREVLANDAPSNNSLEDHVVVVVVGFVLLSAF